jgi:hypothetical protein
MIKSGVRTILSFGKFKLRIQQFIPWKKVPLQTSADYLGVHGF